MIAAAAIPDAFTLPPRLFTTFDAFAAAFPPLRHRRHFTGYFRAGQQALQFSPRFTKQAFFVVTPFATIFATVAWL